ncbi:hypothetical protein AC629_16945 [Bradyrhizobium sp. NAS80.1]|nr:hypothetical protein AC629_16945 [Bradyrhizobium sp. NAS80.1]
MTTSASAVKGLFHVAIKTADLDATNKFYIEVLKLTKVFRPDFPFPGAWLAPSAGGEAIIHVYAGTPALVDGKVPFGTGAVDHVSLLLTGWDDYLARIQASGRDWRAQVIPGVNVWQIFVHDPSGVLLELTFLGRDESRSAPDVPLERQYSADERFGPFRK